MESINSIVGYDNLKIYQNDNWFKFSLESVLLPNFVNISLSDKEILDSLDYIPVEIDVSDLDSDKDYTIIISKPSGIRQISETSTNVSVKLGQETSKEINDVLIETLNLDSNYKVVAIGENSTKTTVIVKGTKNVIDEIDSSMIKATVDLSGYKEGDYEVPVQIVGEDEKATYASKTTKIKVRISIK